MPSYRPSEPRKEVNADGKNKPGNPAQISGAARPFNRMEDLEKPVAFDEVPTSVRSTRRSSAATKVLLPKFKSPARIKAKAKTIKQITEAPKK